MEIHRAPRYPLHGRVQVALPNGVVIEGRTLDIAVGGISVHLADQIPTGVSCTLRFEMRSKGETRLATAIAKAAYGVFSSEGGYRVGFQFSQSDAVRTALINSLVGKKPTVDQSSKPAPAQAPIADALPEAAPASA